MRPRLKGQLDKSNKKLSICGGIEVYTGEGKGKKNIVQLIF